MNQQGQQRCARHDPRRTAAHRAQDAVDDRIPGQWQLQDIGGAEDGFSLSQPFNNCGVGHAAAFAHRLEAVAGAGAVEFVDEGGHKAGAACA